MARAAEPGTEWIRRAACRGTEEGLWFGNQSPAGRERAKEICRRCPVRRECLEDAMNQEQPDGETPAQNLKRRHGIRGAMTAFERFESVYPVEAARIRAEANRRQRESRVRKPA